MALFLFSKPKDFFTVTEKQQIVEAIRIAEKQTSGEIRVFVESKNSYVKAVDRASEVFYNLKMEKTDHRNAVLVYLAVKDKEMALFGDAGIDSQVGSVFWNETVKIAITHFTKQNICTGIIECIGHIGDALKQKFPYDAATDKNELPDDIVFGK